MSADSIKIYFSFKKLLAVSLLTVVLPQVLFAKDCQLAAQKFAELESSIGSASELEESSAKEAFADILALCPSLDDVRYMLALSQMHAGENAAAKETLAAMPSKSKSEARIRLLRANIALRVGELTEASSETEAVLEAQPNNVDAIRTKSLLASRRGDADLAEQLIRRGLQLQPHNAELFYNLGVLLEKQGRFGEAKASYGTAVRKQGTLATAWRSLASLAIREGDSVGAVTASEKAVLHAPGSKDSWFLQFQAFELAKRFSEAAVALDKAAGLGEAPVKISLGQTVLKFRQGLEDEALAEFEKMLEIRNDDVSLLSMYGWALLQVGKAERASVILSRAEKLAPSDYSVLTNLAAARSELGDSAEAKRLLERAVEKNSSNETARRNLKRLSSE